MILRITARCAACGPLGEGTTADPPTSRRHETRWAELNSAAEKHTRVGHGTSVTAVPISQPTTPQPAGGDGT